MLAKSLLIFGLAAIGSSFTVPDGQSNGFYRAYYDEAGNEVHELVPAGSLNSASPPPVLPNHRYSRARRQEKVVARTPIQTWCECDYTMNTADTNAANADLENQIISGTHQDIIWPGTAFYSIRNTAVAFVCNVDNMNAIVPKDIVSTSTKDISAACGLFYPGTSRIQYSQALDYGYMNYTTGLNFCHNAEQSGTHTCSSHPTTSPNLKVTCKSPPNSKRAHYLTIIPVSDQTIKLGTIKISDIMSKMADACGDEGQCVTNPVSIDGELVWPGLGGEVDGETLTITPSGDYPSGMQGNLLAALNAAIGAAVNCTQVVNTPTCPNPESYCPGKSAPG
jgi:hypothetical protein